MPLTKSEFRKNCLNKIKTYSKHNLLYRNKILNLALSKELKNIKNKKILFFWPLGFEANITDSILKKRKECELFLPFMEGESFKMVPFRLPLKKKKFGIYEAGNSLRNISKIDIAIVPAVGVDGSLQRVGFGKGMYDRFFAKLKKKPYVIFVQAHPCYTKESVCDDYDVAADLLLTPKAKIKANSRIKKGR